MNEIVEKKTSLKGEIIIPPDKSISHRAVILSALAKGTSVLRNFSKSLDCISTLNLFSNLGVEYQYLSENDLKITSTGILNKSQKALDCGNSGTTMRLVAGVLAGQNFNSILIGDNSLLNRPMKRIIEPLSLMGAKINSLNFKAPLEIFKSELNGIDYQSKLASAQVKSCVLLAGLNANGKTTYRENYASRNHTERMLELMGAKISVENNAVTIEKSELSPKEITVVGDVSSSAFFVAMGLIVKNSDFIIKNIGLNTTRTGFFDVVQQMGANIQILDKKILSNEEVGDVRVCTSDLQGCTIEGELIPRLIDEIPIIAVLAIQANGDTIIKDAQDLRNKESDRISTVVSELKKLGANIEETQDGMIIHGRTELTGGVEVQTYCDHRLAMSLYIAGMVCKKPIKIKEFQWVNTSFPEFLKLVNSL